LKIKKISKFYLNLHKQELEHIDAFIKMAKVYFNDDIVDERVNQILEQEAKVTSSLPWRSAIH
jgi:tRNA isopentenyl-2-thiomethyl-A-37 hydroxylase MiaE